MSATTAPITVTDAAARKIAQLAGKEGHAEPILRLRVVAGGCSGFSYELGFADAPAADDHVVRAADGVRVVVEGRDRLLGGAKPPGYAVQPRNHNAVAAAVVQGRADWGVTLDTIARTAGLGFIPVQHEQYDFVVPKTREQRPGVKAFRAWLEDPATRERLARLGMKP